MTGPRGDGQPAERRGLPGSRGRDAGEGRRSGRVGAHPTRGAIRTRRRLRRPTLNGARAGALLGLLAAAGSIYGLASRPTFVLDRVELPALTWTSEADLAAAVATPLGTNLIQLRTGPIAARVRALPGVAAATVFVSLPDTLVVEVTERSAVVAWAVGDASYLVDRTGVVFASVGRGEVADGDLRTIDDRRAGSAALAVGSVLDPIDLDAATRLGSIVPADLDSQASDLEVSITDGSGFVMRTRPGSWVAIFGLYTQSLRPPSMIPGQVRLLRSLISGREETVDRVILAGENEGTYIPRGAATSPPVP